MYIELAIDYEVHIDKTKTVDFPQPFFHNIKDRRTKAKNCNSHNSSVYVWVNGYTNLLSVKDSFDYCGEKVAVRVKHHMMQIWQTNAICQVE